VTSDDQGKFRIRVPAGSQYVYIGQDAPPGYLSGAQQSFEPVVQDGQTATVEFQFQRDNSPAIDGIVRGPDGKPVEGAVVSCTDPTGRGGFSAMGVKSATTDADGKFHMPAVAAGSELRVRAKGLATATPVKIGKNARSVTIDLSADAQYTAVIEVVDTGAPGAVPPGATVGLTTMNGNFGYGGQPIPVPADGKVRLESLYRDSNYFINAKADGYGIAQQNIAPGKTAASGKERSIRLELQKETSNVAGMVVDETGAPLADVEVSINGSKTDFKTVKTDADGHFSFDVVPDANGLVYLQHRTNDQNNSMNKNSYAQVKAGQTDVQLIAVRPPDAGAATNPEK
jgi:hypothetical protein